MSPRADTLPALGLTQVVGVLKATDRGFHDGTITLTVTKRLGSVVHYQIRTQEPDELTRTQRELDRLMRERPQPAGKGERL